MKLKKLLKTVLSVLAVILVLLIVLAALIFSAPKKYPYTVADAEATPTGFQLIAGPEVLRALPTREAASHKGD